MGRIDIEPPTTQNKNKDWIRIGLGVMVSLLAIIILSFFVDVKEVKEAFAKANYWMIGGASLITLLWLVVRSIVWRTLLKNRVGYAKIFFTLNEGYLLNNLLPFRLGELGRAFLLSLKTPLSFWEVLSSIIIERGLDIAIASSLLLLTIPFIVGAVWAREAALISGGGILVLFSIMYYLAMHRGAVEDFIQKRMSEKGKIYHLAGKPLLAFIQGIEVLRERGIFVRAVFFMVLNWAVGIGQYYAFLLAFMPNVQPLWVCFAVGVAALGIAAPSSPGAIGVLELSLVGALAVFNIDPSISVAFGMVMHAFQYLITGVLGAYALTQDGESLKSLYKKVKGLRENNSYP